MNDTIKTLIDFGLNENEAKVYLEALKMEETNPYALSRLTKIPRSTVYEVITNLSLKGLITLKKSDGISKQQTRIEAKNPSILREIIRDRKTDLTRMDSEIVHILPELKGEFLKHELSADFKYYSGIEGAKKVFTDAKLDDVDLPEYLFNYKIPDDVFGREYMNWIIDEGCKLKRSHTPKELMPDNDWIRHCVTFHYQRNQEYIKSTEMRCVVDGELDLKIRMAIKGDKVWIVSAEEDEVYGMVVKSKNYAKSMKSMFMLLWGRAIPVNEKTIKDWI